MDYLPEQCTEVRAALPLYVGADLDLREMEAVGAHLAGCASCAGLHERALVARSVLVEGLRRTAAAAAPSLWAGVRAGIQDETHAGRRSGAGDPHTVHRELVSTGSRHALSPVGRRHPRLWAGSAAAAAALTLCLGLAYTLRTPAPTSPLHPSPGIAPAVVTSAPSLTGSTGLAAPVEVASEDPSGSLRHVGAQGQPLYGEAFEVRVDQGICLPRGKNASSDLAGGVFGR